MKYKSLIFILLSVVGIISAKMTPIPQPINMWWFLLTGLSIFGLGVWAGYSFNEERKKAGIKRGD